MGLVQELPPSVDRSLREESHEADSLSVAVKVDIDREGRLGERWLVVDSAAVRVYTPNGSHAYADSVIPLQDVEFARAEDLVGGGSLTVVTGSDTLEVVRYTSALQSQMGGVARTIEALAKNEPAPTVELKERKLCPTCGRPLPDDSSVCSACLNKSAVLSRLFSYAAPHRWKALSLVLLMFAGTAVSLAPGVILRKLTDNVLVMPEGKVAPPLHARLSELGWLVFALIMSQFAGVFLTAMRGRLSAWLSANITYTLRTDVFNKLQTLGLSYYDKRYTGALLTRVTQDVNELNNFLVDGLQILVVNGLTMVGIALVLFFHNAYLTALVLLPIPLVVMITRQCWSFLRGTMMRLWHLRSQLASGLSSVLSGVRVVKAFAQEDREVTRFDEKAHALYQAGLTLETWWATLVPFVNYLMTAGSFIVWYVGGRQVIGHVITLGTLQMFLFFLGQLYGPLQMMTRIADWLSRALTSAERVFEVLDTDPDVRDVPDAVKMPDVKGEVEFRNVSFAYEKSRYAMENLSLHVKAGEMIGLVGHSGAGKTTLINLISRFYDPSSGQILVDGVDMRNIHLHDLRRQLGIVLQEPYLFPGSISDNIAYGKPDATSEQIMRAAKAANAHDFVMRFPDGYDTQVGERGARLSGGERQRLSIARAILHDPKILILDEATASVDTETEQQIQQAISRLVKGRTTFAIAHRLSTLRNADRLVVMEKGKIVEVGTHDELMSKDEGVFRKLVEMQTEINKMRAY